MSTLTAFGNLYEEVENIKNDNPIVEATIAGSVIEFMPLDGNKFTISGVEIPASTTTEAPLDYVIKCKLGTSVAAAQTDAASDFIGILPKLASGAADTDVDLGSTTALEDGKAFRLFVNGPVGTDNDSKKYIIKFQNKDPSDETAAVMRNGEAFTFVYSLANDDFLVIPGITNAKAKTA